jgi:hypothetical protein
MNLSRVRSAAALALVLAACGGGGSSSPHPDAPPPPMPDAPRSVDAQVCTALTAGTTAFVTYDSATPLIIWGGLVPGGLGDGNVLHYQFEFYGGIEPSLAGTFDLSAGNQSNYMTCGVCVHAFTRDAGGAVVKEFFQSAGSVTLSEDPFTNQHMVGTVTGLKLQEVTIDQSTYLSTPVAGGSCTSYADLTVNADNVPAAWTCTHNKYNDGTTCDCMCGTPDPDCNLAAPTVAGCTGAQACFNDMCVNPPANDTCALATPITLGTPVAGTTIGAGKNYDAGLEGAACTNAMQPGSDVAYSINLTAAQMITVTLSGLDTGYDGSVALVGPGAATVCDANPITTCVAGADMAAEGMDETFMYTVPTTGTYYLIVDSFYPYEAGAFTLTVN